MTNVFPDKLLKPLTEVTKEISIALPTVNWIA